MWFRAGLGGAHNSSTLVAEAGVLLQEFEASMSYIVGLSFKACPQNDSFLVFLENLIT